MPRLLFLCTGNSCRSQMAEGFARKYAPEGWIVESAGIEAHGLNPLAVRVMAEVGIDISSNQSRTLQYNQFTDYDVIITVCGHAEKTCPATPPTVKRLHWPFSDPASATGSPTEVLGVFRQVRNEVEQRIKEWDWS